MTTAKVFGVSRIGHTLDRLEVTTDSIKGYAALINTFLEAHVSLAPGVTLGIYALLEEQCRDLEDVADDLREEYQNQRRSEMDEDTTVPIRERIIAALGADAIQNAAARLGLDESSVYNVAVSLAFPNSPLKATKQAEQRIAKAEKKLKYNLDAVEIAETLNLKASTVQKVIDVLTAGSQPVDGEVTPQATSKAANE